MSEIELILLEADRFLEAGAFANAVERYRAATMVFEPSKRTWANLDIAEDMERAEFRRTLTERYPKSAECVIGAANARLRAGSAGAVVDQRSELLERPGLSEEAALAARLLRLRASPDANRWKEFQADFTWLWLAGEHEARYLYFRRRLLRDVAGLTDPRSTQMLRSLIAEGWLPRSLSELVVSKADELEKLDGALRDLS